jgi:hypothetical protein
MVRKRLILVDIEKLQLPEGRRNEDVVLELSDDTRNYIDARQLMARGEFERGCALLDKCLAASRAHVGKRVHTCKCNVVAVVM